MNEQDDSERTGIKVTDRRMFFSTGELREEFQEHADALPPDLSRQPSIEAAPLVAEPAIPAAQQPAQPRAVQPSPAGYPDGEAKPEFLDIVGMLVESAALLLGDARLPGGEVAEDLDRARYHIDLLDVLQERTLGNLTEQEDSVLSDLLYRLRLRYVQKRR